MLLLCITAGCAPQAGGGEARDPEESVAMPDMTIEAAQAELTDSLLGKPGVVGTAIGLCDGIPCIKVFLARQDEELLEMIPSTHRGFPVDVEVTGEFRAREKG